MTLMTGSLTQPISGRLWFAILIITFGAEIDLYLTRYSYFASNLYDAIMVSSFFIGIHLHNRLANPNHHQKTKRQHILQFTGAFLLFFIGSTIINLYSGMAFTSFNNNYDQNVQSYAQTQSTNEEPATVTSNAFFEKVDAIGPDFYTDSLAGLEEVWRLAYMILILVICKKLFRHRWDTGSRDIFLLLSLFITSVMFGIDHTLDAAQTWPIKIGAIVTFADMGFLFGLILFWTRNLWIAVAIHSIYDISASISWYYFDYTLEAIAAVVFVIHLILYILERKKQRQQKREQTVEKLQIAE